MKEKLLTVIVRPATWAMPGIVTVPGLLKVRLPSVKPVCSSWKSARARLPIPLKSGKLTVADGMEAITARSGVMTTLGTESETESPSVRVRPVMLILSCPVGLVPVKLAKL